MNKNPKTRSDRMQKMDFFSIYSLLGQQNTVCTHRKSKTVEILI